MKKIFKLTIFSFAGPFVATFFVVLFTLLMQFLWKYIDDLVGKGLEWYIIGELLFYASASFIPLALPLSILLSSIMTFGKLSETYELVSLKSAGISLFRAMYPMITLIAMISVAAFFITNNVIPRANLKYLSLLWDIRNQRPALDIKEGVFYGGLDNYSIRINKKDKEGKHLQDIMIYDHTHGRGNDVVLTSESGSMKTTPDKRYLVLNLYNGTRYEEMDPQKGGAPTFPASRLQFKSYELRFDLSNFSLAHTQEELFKHNYQMLNEGQLQFYIDSLNKSKNRTLTEQSDFSRPYFQVLRDTFLARQPLTLGKLGQAAPGKRYVETFKRTERHELIMRALSSARTLKETYRIQAESISSLDDQLIKYRMEWHRKLALSLACLTLFFIGAPLGAVIRKGGIGTPTVVAIILFIIYYFVNIFGEKLAKEGTLTVFTGVWIANMALLPIGILLTHLANIDRIRININISFRWLKALRKRFTKDKADANTTAH